MGVIRRYGLKSLIVVMMLGSNLCFAASFTDNEIADAIYWAEGGECQYPYGIRSIKTDDPRRICLNTIRNQRRRWRENGEKEPYLVSLRNRYCPIGAENDPKGLNSNWLKNVKWFLNNPKEVSK